MDASWRDLPPSLVVSTARYLDAAHDVLALESVCSTWRRALSTRFLTTAAVEDEIWLPIVKKRFPNLDLEPVESFVVEENENKKRVVECRPRKRNYSYRSAHRVQLDVEKLRHERGVGSPEDMHGGGGGGKLSGASPSSMPDNKASSLSDYTVTVEGVFGPDAFLLDSDEVEEALKCRDSLKRYTWTGAMDFDWISLSRYARTAVDAPHFNVPRETVGNDICSEELRVYVTSPSLVTYKLFEFDCCKMTSTITESRSGGSSPDWLMLYNECGLWSLPYEFSEPKGGIKLMVSLTVGKTRANSQMLGLQWTGKGHNLDEDMVLAYLNGKRVDLDDYASDSSGSPF